MGVAARIVFDPTDSVLAVVVQPFEQLDSASVGQGMSSSSSSTSTSWDTYWDFMDEASGTGDGVLFLEVAMLHHFSSLFNPNVPNN